MTDVIEERKSFRLGGLGLGHYYVSAWNCEGHIQFLVVNRWISLKEGPPKWCYSRRMMVRWGDVGDLLVLSFWFAFKAKRWLRGRMDILPEDITAGIKRNEFSFDDYVEEEEVL